MLVQDAVQPAAERPGVDQALLSLAAGRALTYLQTLDGRSVFPGPDAVAGLAALGGPLPEGGCDPHEVIQRLDEAASPATVAIGGGRYFGFVNGGVLPVALAANWLASAWGQNAALWVMSPAAAELERIALNWLAELLGLPSGCGGALVTGATMANFVGLAAARHALLSREGWDVERQGLFGAPPIDVVVPGELHASVFKAIGMLGLGRDRVVRVPVDGQGRIKPDALPRLSPRTILCLQAGNVNSGAFDPYEVPCRVAHDAGAWVHVDGAFGLWAMASKSLANLTAGLADADSWATDAHKTLNSGYDCGVAFVRDAAAIASAMSLSAPYLIINQQRQPMHFTPESSRRARGVELWAVLKHLGRAGVAAMVERMCANAIRIAGGLRNAGYQVLNQVDFNQVVVSFGDPQRTLRVIDALQKDGTCWCGSTEWHGNTAMRISISSWATTAADVDRSVAAILRIAKEEGSHE